MAIDIGRFYHHVRHATLFRAFANKRVFAILIGPGQVFAEGTSMVESGRSRADC